MTRTITRFASAVLLVFSGAINGATINVNSTSGGTIEALAGNGTCDFAEAILAADSDTAVDTCNSGNLADKIELKTLEGTIDQDAEVGLSIDSEVAINGPGADKLTIMKHHLSIDSDGHVTVSGITLDHAHSGNPSLFHISRGTAFLDSVRLVRSFGGDGSAAYVWNGVLKIINSELSDNISLGDGGAIWGRDSTVEITNSTISSNITLDFGSAIFCDSCELSISNSTISNNRKVGSIPPSGSIKGPAIFISTLNSPSWTVVSNSIIADNYLVEGGVITGFEGDIVGRSDYEALLWGRDHEGYIESSIIDESEFLSTVQNMPLFFNLIHDQVESENIKILPLCNNGGPTQTHATGDGSVAHNFGHPGFGGLATDQRGYGYPRILNHRVDAGAYEYDSSLFRSSFEISPEGEDCPVVEK